MLKPIAEVVMRAMVVAMGLAAVMAIVGAGRVEAQALADRVEVENAVLPAVPGARVDEHRAAGRHWYGGEILIVDGASTALVAPMGVGLLGLVFAAPIVHLAHGRPGAALASLGLRVLLPVVFGVTTLLVSDPCNGEACEWGPVMSLIEAYVAAAVGLTAAVSIDVSLLAFEDREVSATAEARPAAW